MCDEVFSVGAVHDNDTQRRIRVHPIDQESQLGVDVGVDQVHRRVVDGEVHDAGYRLADVYGRCVALSSHSNS
jgi:hypothetical protein